MNHNEVTGTLAEMGIIDSSGIMDRAGEEVGKIIATISHKITQQLTYNLLYNIPTGNLKPEEITQHAIKTGLVTAIGIMHDWDIDSTITFAADLLDDVNAHEEAQIVRKLSGIVEITEPNQ